MKSIKSKIILLVLFSTIFLSTLLGIVVFVNVKSIINQNAALTMLNITQSQKLNLDSLLKSVEATALDIAHKAKSESVDFQTLKNDQIRENFVNNISSFAFDIASGTYGTISFYFRLNPDIAGGKEGFFYAKQKWKKTFFKLENTDILSFAPDDVQLNWWNNTKNLKKPSWISPYYDKSLDMLVISYTVPFFDEQKNFIGIIGIDIDFSIFLDMVQNFSLYNNGVAHLADMATKQVFNNIDNANTLITTDEHTNKIEFSDFMANENSGNKLRTYFKDGKKHKLAFETLENGMKFIIHAPENEIYEQSNKLLFVMYSIIVFVVALSSLLAFWFSKKLIDPLLELNVATKQISEGNYDINIKKHSNDEIGELAGDIEIMANKIKDYTSQMSNLAYKDPLTGIRNKVAYSNYTKNLKDKYAIVVFGINNLKIINEKYEYSTGDAVVVMASKYICKVFSHSAIFRLESDEFAAILLGEDFENREEIIKFFQEKMGENELEIPPYSALSIAHGMAICDNTQKSFKEVYLEATSAMLECKRQMKEQ